MRTAWLYVAALLLIVGATVGVLWQPVLLVVVAVGVWAIVPRRPDVLPRRLVLLVALFTFSSLLPSGLGLPVQVGVLGMAFVEWLAVPAAKRRGGAVVLACLAIIGYWTLLALLHPNVPDLQTGLLGMRKTVLAFGGLILGCAIASHQRRSAERTVIFFLALAMVASIVGHFFVPAIEQAVTTRAADEYTAIFDGQRRLQGVFSGPFHAAMCGVTLVAWGLARWRTGGRWPAWVLLLGAVGTYLTLVRTSYIAVALAVVALIMMAGSIGTFLRRAALAASGVVIVAAVAALSGRNLIEPLQSIANFSTDGRFQGRLPQYQIGLDLFGASPVFGWGAGSAGDTLGPAFRQGEHVTPHNLLLKFAVEGGLIGLLLLVAVGVAVWRAIDRSTPGGQLGVAAVVGLLGLGLTGSAIDTLPVSYFVLMLAGLAIGSTAGPASPYAAAHDRRNARQAPPVRVEAQPVAVGG